ncbi:SMC-Scp complex subunit ScpB [Candidatus Saccharibacteria bacterium]|nr:SMC-Scp complex subunit ScpB [Candidatus Saccharibacteria bacterium]
MSAVDKHTLSACLEALLFASPTALPLKRIAELLVVSSDEIEACIEQLRRELDARGSLTIISGAEGYELSVHPSQREFITQSFAGQATPLSQSGLEVIAILAYDGPKTKAEIDEIRGVSSDATVRSLLARDIIIKQKASKALQPKYELTNLAWRTLGLRSREELPPMPEEVQHEA